MCSVILLAGIRSPVIGEIKNCSLAVGTAAAGLGAEVQDNSVVAYNITKFNDTIISYTV